MDTDRSSFTLRPGRLSLADLRLFQDRKNISLAPEGWDNLERGAKALRRIMEGDAAVYGVNTGFGPLSGKTLDAEHYQTLQRRLLMSNAAGVGEPLSRDVVRRILVLKLSTISRGVSGVRPGLAQALLDFLNHDIVPVVPGQGSVGASGDLAPLAHIGLALMGMGDVYYQGMRCSAMSALQAAGLEPFVPAAKEGLAIVNGTQVSTALAVDAFFRLESMFVSSLCAAALSVDAGCGTVAAYDERIHEWRGQAGQQSVAAWMRGLLEHSPIQAERKKGVAGARMQDPYCLRCVPQVMGAVLDQVLHVASVLECEINAVTDNPLIDSQTGDVLYGGNFHAQPVGMAADLMALCFAEIGGMSERRIAFLVDRSQSGLPDFLVDSEGLDSGFMVAQVTAAALASENKSLSFPASVDSIPTAANLEDYVSMATHAARRLLPMADNVEKILAIELLAAAQGLEFRRPLNTSPLLEQLHDRLRSRVPAWDEDRFFAPDIESSQDVLRIFTDGQSIRGMIELPSSA